MKPYIDQTPDERRNSLKIVGLAIFLNIPFLTWIGWVVATKVKPTPVWFIYLVGNIGIGTYVLKFYVKRLRRKAGD